MQWRFLPRSARRTGAVAPRRRTSPLPRGGNDRSPGPGWHLDVRRRQRRRESDARAVGTGSVPVPRQGLFRRDVAADRRATQPPTVTAVTACDLLEITADAFRRFVLGASGVGRGNWCGDRAASSGTSAVAQRRHGVGAAGRARLRRWFRGFAASCVSVQSSW